MLAPHAAPRVLVRRNNRPVASLTFGQRPVIYDATEAPLIKLLLEQPRFVYDPESRQLRAFGHGQRAIRPDWWLLHVQEALWPKYELTFEQS